MKFLGREPALWLQAASAALAVLVTFGWSGLSSENAGAIVAVISGLFALATAFTVRPIAPAVFNLVIQPTAALLATYGLDLSAERVGLFQLAVTAVMALLLRQQVTPAADPQPEPTVVVRSGPLR